MFWNSHKKEYEYRRRDARLCGAIEEHNQYWASSHCDMAYGDVCKVVALFNDTSRLKSTTSQRVVVGSSGYDINTDLTTKTADIDTRTEKTHNVSETTAKKVYNASYVYRFHEKPENSYINSVNIIVISLLTTTVIILVVISFGVCFKRKLESLAVFVHYTEEEQVPKPNFKLWMTVLLFDVLYLF